MEKVEEKINNLQKELKSIVGYLSNAPKPALPSAEKAQLQQVQVVSAVSPTMVQGRHSIVLRCKQWEEFQVLAIRAQTLVFSYNEDAKVFEVDALKGNQIITYRGTLPNFSLILKMWLSRKLEIAEQRILEGSLDKPK